jgi:hypothetical protein
MPSAPTQYSQIPGPVGNLPGLVAADANGALANVVAPWYLNGAGLWVPAPADAAGNPITAATGSAPTATATITVASTNTNTTLSTSAGALGSLVFGTGLFDAKQATVRLYNNGTGQTITSVQLALSDTVGGQSIPVTYTQTVSIASGGSDVVIFPLTQGTGSTPVVSVTFGTAPTAGSVALGVDWQSAGAPSGVSAAAPVWTEIQLEGGGALAASVYSNDGDGGGNTFGVSPRLWNGASYDRQHNNTQGTLLASAARTSAGTSQILTNYNGPGIVFTINVTAVSGTSPEMSFTLDLIDPVTGNPTYIGNSANITAIGTYSWVVYPTTGVASPGGQSLGVTTYGLPRTFVLSYNMGGTSPSFTFSVGYSFLS